MPEYIGGDVLKNRTIYKGTFRWMLIPVISNVIYEISAIFVTFITASYLGNTTDAALNGEPDVLLEI